MYLPVFQPFFLFSHAPQPGSSVCCFVFVWVLNCVYVCFNLGCSNAELLSLHRSSPHTWCFWGCRWRLSTSTSPYLTHPPTSPWFFFSFLCTLCFPFVFSVPVIFSWILPACFFSCPSVSVFFFLHSAPGCWALQWNRMLPPVQLPVDHHSAVFFSVPSLQGCQHALLCFMSAIFSPQCQLQCYLTCHHINLQDFLCWKKYRSLYKVCICERMNDDKSPTMNLLSRGDKLVWIVGNILLLSACRIRFWHRSV